MNHMNAYPTVAAVSVNGTPIFIKSANVTISPFFLKMPTAVIFADAPTGVRFPPSVAPQSSPRYRSVGSTPSEDDTP